MVCCFHIKGEFFFNQVIISIKYLVHTKLLIGQSIDSLGIFNVLSILTFNLESINKQESSTHLGSCVHVPNLMSVKQRVLKLKVNIITRVI